ncbi:MULTISPECIES: hypothetical protein [Paenibacillus]|uniref:Uncharacterized protein n=1 Tax=Paenibacillus lactis 154 TaxID=743719 RepID=G4HNX8_9BACL|nr:hypothetical protein [Paenibacillus lactis]EHB50142.1 hypothetical protein PaelaDRAFT_5689 [Paenibacillus lactis 154]
MLPDLERKILRILYNYVSQHHRIPTMHGLEVMTGRKQQEIKNALLMLEKERYIEWEDKSSLGGIKIIEGWEREPQANKKPTQKVNAQYWTDY